MNTLKIIRGMQIASLQLQIFYNSKKLITVWINHIQNHLSIKLILHFKYDDIF